MATDAYTNKCSDQILTYTTTQTFSADGTYNLVRIPRYALIHECKAQVITALDGSGAATLGFSGNGETADTDAFMDAATFGADVTGLKSMLAGSADLAEGKYFSDGTGSLTLTLAKGTSTTNLKVRIFCTYTVIHP